MMTELEFNVLSPKGTWPVTGRVSSGAHEWVISTEQLRHQSDPQRQKALFKAHVRRVVVETASYCNRRCVFCPNTDGSRLQPQRKMPCATYSALIQDLAEIEFSGQILFHFYNEPLANPLIFDQITEARRALPFARLAFNSNGDYLKKGTLDKLAQAGLDQINLSVYGPSHGAFEPEYVEQRVSELIDICELAGQRPRWVNAGDCQVVGQHVVETPETGTRSMKVFIQAKNHNLSGYDRGGLMVFDDRVLPERHTPCPSPFEEVLVGWNSLAVPCCNIVPDNEAHADYVVGELGPRGSVFEIYAGRRLAAWRRNLLRAAPHSGPCRHCTRLYRPVAEHLHAADGYNAKIDTLLVQAASEAEVP